MKIRHNSHMLIIILCFGLLFLVKELSVVHACAGIIKLSVAVSILHVRNVDCTE